MWDLAPTGGNQCSGVKQNFTDAQALFLTDAPDRIGPSPSKARYVEYTDATFTTPRVRPSAALARRWQQKALPLFSQHDEIQDYFPMQWQLTLHLSLRFRSCPPN